MSLVSSIKSIIYDFALIVESPRRSHHYLRGVSLGLLRKLDVKWIQDIGLATILDIGANVGQFALAANAAFPQARIYSFEPIPHCFSELQRCLEHVNNFQGFNVGLGEKSEKIIFCQNNFSPSSSFLKMTSLHKEAFPHTLGTKNIEVSVECLDDFATKLEIQLPLMIKLDVQGYESQVLNGGYETFKKAAIIIIETSFVTLYEGQDLFDDIYKRLLGMGFSYFGAIAYIHDPVSGFPLQGDSIFIRQ